MNTCTHTRVCNIRYQLIPKLILVEDRRAVLLAVLCNGFSNVDLKVEEAFGDLLLKQCLGVAFRHFRFVLHWTRREGEEGGKNELKVLPGRSCIAHVHEIH